MPSINNIHNYGVCNLLITILSHIVFSACHLVLAIWVLKVKTIEYIRNIDEDPIEKKLNNVIDMHGNFIVACLFIIQIGSILLALGYVGILYVVGNIDRSNNMKIYSTILICDAISSLGFVIMHYTVFSQYRESVTNAVCAAFIRYPPIIILTITLLFKIHMLLMVLKRLKIRSIQRQYAERQRIEQCLDLRIDTDSNIYTLPVY